MPGQLGMDEVTPATDLRLVLNTIHGQQQFDFEKGKRVNPIEAVFPLQGEVNFYPFDRHKGTLWFFVTIPEQQKVASVPIVKPKPKAQEPAKQRGLFGLRNRPPDNVPKELTDYSPSLPVGSSALQKRVQADTRMNFNASIPGLTFRGSHFVESAEGFKGLTGIEVDLRRSAHVVTISMATMFLMAALGIGVVAMALKITSGTRRMANFHVPMAVSLMFGLPALRNIQSGIPPIGTFGDSVAFVWAEAAAAGSVIALVIHWLLHRTSEIVPPIKK